MWVGSVIHLLERDAIHTYNDAYLLKLFNGNVCASAPPPPGTRNQTDI